VNENPSRPDEVEFLRMLDAVNDEFELPWARSKGFPDFLLLC
jgi:hypothetical protein